MKYLLPLILLTGCEVSIHIHTEPAPDKPEEQVTATHAEKKPRPPNPTRKSREYWKSLTDEEKEEFRRPPDYDEDPLRGYGNGG